MFQGKTSISIKVLLPLVFSFLARRKYKYQKLIQDLLDDAKDPGSDPVAVKAMKTFDLMDKVGAFSF